MKWRLVKLLCIAGTGVLGALLFGDAVAGIVVAPFGWIIGRAGELGAEAKEVGVSSGEVMEVQEGEKTQELLRKSRLEEDWLSEFIHKIHNDPTYWYFPSNINYDPEDDFGPPW